MPEDENMNDVIQDISDIKDSGSNCAELLNQIESDLQDLNEHAFNIEEFILIKKEEENKENEQTKEEDIKKEETKAGTGEEEEQEEVITLADIHTEIQQVNDNLSTTNNLLITNVFSNGILVGVLLFTLFWNRVFK